MSARSYAPLGANNLDRQKQDDLFSDSDDEGEQSEGTRAWARSSAERSRQDHRVLEDAEEEETLLMGTRGPGEQQRYTRAKKAEAQEATRRKRYARRTTDEQDDGDGLESRELMFGVEDGSALPTRSSLSRSSTTSLEGGRKDDDSDGYEYSDEKNGSSKRRRDLHEKDRSRPRSRFRRVCVHLLLYTLVIALFIGIAFGAWQATRESHSPQADPPARPTATNKNERPPPPPPPPKATQSPTSPQEHLQPTSNGTSIFNPTTILVSLDGFRADFLTRGLTPTLSSLIRSGISPLYMTPSFPSVTFPNHYTMVTGMYPESHGVVGNTFWDPELKEEFYYTHPSHSMQPKWWNAAEPLWVTAEKQGIRTAVHMWPGSEAHIDGLDGVEPTFLDKFDSDERLDRKVDRVLGWLDLPSEHDPDAPSASDALRPQLVLFYVPEVDKAGHLYGPNSTAMRTSIGAVDNMLGTLLSGLDARNLTSIVNVVVVSDHGMASTSTSRVLQLEDLLPGIDIEASVDHIDGWPHFGLRPHTQPRHVDGKLYDPTTLTTLYNALTTAHAVRKEADLDPGFDVYLTDENMPARFHFANNPRIAPLWIFPRPGWAIARESEFNVTDALARGYAFHPRGVHGYDHEHPLMRAVFVAHGPAFAHAPHSRMDTFGNTEVYGIICESIGVKAKENNGTLSLPLKSTGLHDDKFPEEQDGEAVDWEGDPVEKEVIVLTWKEWLEMKAEAFKAWLDRTFKKGKEGDEKDDEKKEGGEEKEKAGA